LVATVETVVSAATIELVVSVISCSNTISSRVMWW
jgi:hypothetical protein